MSINKDHQSAEATEQTTEPSLDDQIQQLTDERDLAKADLAKAHTKIQELEEKLKESEELKTRAQSLCGLTEALWTHCRSQFENYKAQIQGEFEQERDELKSQAKTQRDQIQNLEAQLKESEEHRNTAEANFQVSEHFRILFGRKIRTLEAKLRESETLRAQSEANAKELHSVNLAILEKFDMSLRAQLAQAQAKIQESECQVKTLQKSLEIQKIQAEAKLNESELLRIQAQTRFQKLLKEFKARKSELEAQLIDMTAEAQGHVDEIYDEWEAKNKKDVKELKEKLAKDKLEISRLTQLAENQETQFTALKVIQNTKLEEARSHLKIKENEVVTLQRSLEAANWKLDTEQKKFEVLQQEQRENAEYVMEMRDKNLLQVEIQLEKSQEEVRVLREETLVYVEDQLEKSQTEVRRVLDIVKEKEDKLEEAEAKLAEAQAPRKRGRPAKAETAAKKRKIN